MRVICISLHHTFIYQISRRGVVVGDVEGAKLLVGAAELPVGSDYVIPGGVGVPA